MRGADGDGTPVPVSIEILGDLTLRVSGAEVPAGSLRQQICLGLLASSPNRVVPVATLVDAIWDDRPPRTARKNLQVYLAGMRRLLGDGGGQRLTYRSGGYRLQVSAQELDLLCFDDYVAEGRRAASAGDPARAAAAYRAALRLWRGVPLERLDRVEAIRQVSERLSARHVAALESWGELELQCGDASVVAEELAEAGEQHPLRERLALVRLTALARCGRTGEALGVYSDLRRALAADLGLEPSPAVAQVHRELLGGGAGTLRPIPAGRSGSAVLPAAAPCFTGRSGELAEAVDALGGDRGGRVVLHGVRGSGRTALAVEVARRAAGRYRDGCLWAAVGRSAGPDAAGPDAAGPDPVVAVLRDLLAQAGRPAADGADPAELARRWQQVVADRRVLLVLDDVPDHATAEALLPAVGPAGVLMTALGPLPGVDRAYRVRLGPLDVADAVRLLSRVSGRVLGSTEVGAAEDVVHAVGRWPSAVCRAGLRLAQLPFLSVERFAGRLADGCPVTALDGPDGELARRLDGILSGLPGRQRSALAGLSAGLGRVFSAEDAASVWQIGVDAAFDRLETLMNGGVLGLHEAEVEAQGVLLEVPPLLRARAAAQA